MDRLVAERTREKSRNADDGVTLLELLYRETVARGDGSYLAIVRPDGPPERIHVP